MELKPFMPKYALFEEEALEYPMGKRIHELMVKKDIPIEFIESHNRIKYPEVLAPEDMYKRAKETLVVGVKKTLRFQPCQPSADYRIVTSTSCPGKCEYCYLGATLGRNVHIRVYVNIGEILEAASKHIDKNEPRITTFEASSSSDPVAVEHLTGAVRYMITYFAGQPYGRLRIASKATNVDSFLELEHNKHTKYRSSINSTYVVDTFEKNTPSLDERIDASSKMRSADYPIGFIVAPIMLYDGWEEGYGEMIRKLEEKLEGDGENMTFELIMHRFTQKSKRLIEERFPGTQLEMEKKKRTHKGFGKYVYPAEEARTLETFMKEAIRTSFPKAQIEYFT